MDFNKHIFIGTDIEKINRFENKTVEKSINFLKKIFTDKEIEYCFSNKFPSPHLTARFCAKEAVIKALYSAGIKGIYYSDIEVFHDENMCPMVNIKNHKKIKVKLSISHSIDYATATAILYID